MKGIVWTDELAVATLKEVAVDGMMPSCPQLTNLKLRSLWNYMSMSGGFVKFANAAELQLSKQAQAKINRFQWSDETVVEKLKELAVNRIMPTSTQLCNYNLRPMWEYIRRNGGVEKFADAADLTLTNKSQAFANSIVWSEDLAISKLREISVNGIMPSQKQIQRMNLKPLWRYISKHGGATRFAELSQLQLSPNALAQLKSIDWNDHLVTTKLLEVAQNGLMPSSSQLNKLGLRSLYDYIRKNGGISKYANLCGLTLDKDTIRGLDNVCHNWTDQKVLATLKDVAINGMMPSNSMLREMNLGSVWAYMAKNGGVQKYSELSGLSLSKQSHGRMNAIKWTRELVIDKLREVAVNGIMPTTKQLRNQKLQTLYTFMLKNGGILEFADLAGLRISNKSRLFCEVFNNKQTTRMTITVRSDLPKVSNKQLNQLLASLE